MTAKWRMIEGDLRSAIAGMAAGDRIPSEPELMARYGTSRGPARRAIEALIDEGLVTPDRRVSKRTLITISITPTESVSWRADMEAQGYQPGIRITVTVSGSTVTRHVLRLVDGRPHNLTEWTFPMQVVRGTPLLVDEDIPGGSVAVLEEKLRCEIRQVTTVETRMPSPEESEQLKMPARGVPVIVIHRTGRRPTGKQVFTAVQILRADQTRLVPVS